MKRCTACGVPVRKTVRAMVIRSDQSPRMGLVCRHCANCGMLVVPGSLKILPDKPRRVSRTEAMAKIQGAMPRFKPNTIIAREIESDMFDEGDAS